MNKRKQVSIKDIARLSGFSVATVSRVINGTGRFSEKTRRTVEAIIKEQNYKANMAGKALRVNKSKSIGMIVPDITNEFFAKIVSQVETYFFDRGYSVFICNINEIAEKERAYFEILESKLVDGVICISSNEDISSFTSGTGIPVVCIDRMPKCDSNVFFVESDHLAGGYMATELLLKKGCRNIVMLSKRAALSPDAKRLEGYRRAHARYGLPVDEELIVYLGEDVNNFGESRDAVRGFVVLGKKFDGVFGTNDLRAFGALVALQQENIRVPEQVKIVGFDDATCSWRCHPAITTVRQDTRELSLIAARMLLEQMQDECLGERHVVIPVGIVERGTT